MKKFNPPTEQGWMVVLLVVGSCWIEAGWQGGLAAAGVLTLMILLGWLFG